MSSFRRSVLVLALVAGWPIAGGAAGAQRLLTLGPELPDPAEPRVLAQEARSDSAPLPAARPSRAVEVDLDLVRSAPPRLELPTPDGRVLVADLTVFEDRGGGDVLWSGRFPGAAYDSVVLTIADGGLAGNFDEPFGEKYRIAAADDGRGKMVNGRRLAVGRGAAECGVGAEAGDLLHEHLARALDRNPARRNSPQRIASPQTGDELKILVLWTRSAARNWEDPDSEFYAGSTRAALRNAADYLRTVFRNGGLGLDPVVVFERAPGYLDRVAVEGETFSRADISDAFVFNAEPDLLRRRHGADLVHLFFGPSVVNWSYSGKAALKHGVSLQGVPTVFAHEIGHQLGGHHQPDLSGPSREWVRRVVEEEGWPAWNLYAFAHGWYRDGTPTPDGRRGDFGSAVAYPSTEPFYSTVRIRPGGRRLGIAGERENERAFRDSVFDRAGWSALEQDDPLPPTNLEVQRIGPRSVRIAWTDNSNNEDNFHVIVTPQHPVQEDVSFHPPADRESVVVEDLKPGSYQVLTNAQRAVPGGFAVSAFDYGWFVVPGAEPAAPREVEVAFVPQPGCAAGTQGVVNWSETFTAEEAASNETALEIQVFREGRLWHRVFEAPGVETARFNCLDDAAYNLRMFAHSFGGRSPASATVTVQGDPPPPPDPDPDPDPPPPDSACAASAGNETLCLHAGRFEVRVEWRTGDGETGSAVVVQEATEDSGLFRFFDANNWEILIKVLNACAVNDHYWVYGASTTDLGYAIRVTDTATGDMKEYRNAPGTPAAAITDARAFPGSCRP